MHVVPHMLATTTCAPSRVRKYCTRGGIAVTTSRVTMPSRSGAWSVWDSIFSLTPSTRRRRELHR